MNLSLVYLKYFCDAVKLGGISSAAKANFVTQSAVSQGISKLEESLGASLVAKHPNRFKLTPVGEWTFQQGVDILRKIEQFQSGFREERVGALEFASTHSLAVSVVPHHLEAFREELPDVPVNFHSGGKDAIKQMLKMGTIDFGLMADEEDLSEFETQEILKGSFGLYCASRLKKKEIAKLGLILPDDDCKEVLFLKTAYSKSRQKEPPTFLRVNSWEIIAHFAIAGLGMGYLPDYVAKSKQDVLQQVHANFPAFSYRISAVYPRGVRLRQSSKAFLAQFTENRTNKE
jgi:DNA-binding transcriptional LysR family regulator